MNSTKAKALVIVFALLVFTGIAAVGCKSTHHAAWVNTDSMPGKTFNKYLGGSQKTNSPAVVYLGSKDDQSQDMNFGPKDVSFDFKSLKR